VPYYSLAGDKPSVSSPVNPHHRRRSFAGLFREANANFAPFHRPDSGVYLHW
jgi:hypothetical protein